MPDLYSILLSVFNVAGTAPKSLKGNGLEGDLQQLSKDQCVLEEDYRKATQRLAQDLGKGES